MGELIDGCEWRVANHSKTRSQRGISELVLRFGDSLADELDPVVLEEVEGGGECESSTLPKIAEAGSLASDTDASKFELL